MLNFIKKHKLIFILLLFILFLLINTKVNAGTIEHNGNTINTSTVDSWKFGFIMYDKTNNTYLLFDLFRTSNGGGSNRRFYIVKEDENYLYISGRSDQYFYNCTAIYNYNISTGDIGSLVSSINYAGNTTSSNSNNGSYKIDKNRYSFVYKCESTKIYTDETCTVENTTSKFFGNILPKAFIKYNEKTSSYWVYTDWYDVREVSISTFYCYGEYKDFNLNDESQPWEFDNIVTEMQYDELGNFTYMQREGFELWKYAFYSYCVYDGLSNEWFIYGLDFTEEGLKGTEYEDCLNPLTNMNLYLDDSTNPPTVYSNFFSNELLDKCNFVDFSVSFDDGATFTTVHIDCEEERIAEGESYTRFYYKLFANDTYTFKLTIFDENYKAYEVEKTFTINSFNEIIDVNGTDSVPATPFITAYADSDIIRFSTQTFKERVTLDIMGDVDTLRYTAYYIDEDAYQLFGDVYEDWILMDVGYEEYDKVIKGYPYYFKTEFSFDNLENGDKFYFIFYDNKLGCFSPVTTYILESKEDLYTISQNITFNNDKFQRLYNFFNEHFGFLSYPLEFIINLLTRILNINYEEPILHFPQIINPINDEVIFNGFDFNFNSILEYKGISYFYNIYLIAVDFILVVAFVIGCKNTLEEVLGNG